jgi:hypothetical protein
LIFIDSSTKRGSQLSTATATGTQACEILQLLSTSTKMSSIVHVVLFQFKPELSPETVLDVQQPIYFTLTRPSIYLTSVLIGVQAGALAQGQMHVRHHQQAVCEVDRGRGGQQSRGVSGVKGTITSSTSMTSTR